jgi:hypothetical protein
MYGFAILIQRGTAHLDDALVWLGTRKDDFQNLAFYMQRIAGPRRFGPCQIATQADDAIAERQSTIHKQAHGDSCGVPSAGGQSAEYAGLRGGLIKVERLRIKLRGKALNFRFRHMKGAGSEPLAHIKVVEIESRFILD